MSSCHQAHTFYDIVDGIQVFFPPKYDVSWDY